MRDLLLHVIDRAPGTYFITDVDFIHGTLCPFVLVVQLCMKFWTNYVHGALMVSTPAAGIQRQTNLAVAFSGKIVSRPMQADAE